MNAAVMQVLTRAMYVMVQRLGGTVEISREELENVSISEHAITISVDEPTGILIIKATNPPQAKKYAEENGLKPINSTDMIPKAVSPPPKKQLFLISTEGKTDEEIEKEALAAYEKSTE